MTLEEMEAEVAKHTSRLDDIDRAMKQARIGADMVLAYRCSHSGLYYPSDYLNQWGRVYGLGLGPEPVSECADTEYHMEPPRPNRVQSIDQVMYPIRITAAQVDYAIVPREEFQANRIIMKHLDPGGRKRAQILIQKQMQKPGSKLPAFIARLQEIQGRYLPHEEVIEDA